MNAFDALRAKIERRKAATLIATGSGSGLPGDTLSAYNKGRQNGFSQALECIDLLEAQGEEGTVIHMTHWIDADKLRAWLAKECPNTGDSITTLQLVLAKLPELEAQGAPSEEFIFLKRATGN